ncbi:PepSY-associated TM helix domain-containing protein [Jeotgalibacillus terrae]|uniref:PepSY-associated TM helix domain-containing protein n=1 Tax=Jeotgalibacillus terrae TaxID=587735 RepID=A0ABW5ZHH1_9BACL|nr:PepSY domain-containing protein [Jeotgalibacillus terrae]MBM7578662.1 putative iron-regulated membrane protein [Jeotgalibacillus terrae]
MADHQKKSAKAYQTIWRWHFYAGIIIAPVLLVLAVTGAIYLFKWNIEDFLYEDLYEIEAEGQQTSPSVLVSNVQALYGEDVAITRYRPGESAERSVEIGISDNGVSKTVFMNPYNGYLVGEINDEERVMDIIEKIHGELMAGTMGDRIVELVAGWTIILVVTGYYLFWPRGKFTLWGTLLPRLKKNRRMLIRDIHVVPAVWISAGLVFLLMTGMLWTGFWGDGVQRITTNAGVGYPPSVWVGDAPVSEIVTEDVAEVAWAAETLPVPESVTGEAYIPVTLDDVVAQADRLGVHSSYQVYFPSGPEGVYTLSAFPDRAEDEATIHLDQYTGAVLADYRFDQYEPLGKVMAIGITLHKGLQYGIWNQMAGLAICIGLLLIVISGLWMWLMRKPSDSMGAPKALAIHRIKWTLVILIGFSLFFPLVGLSVIVIFLLDYLLLKRVAWMRKFFNIRQEEQ